MITGLYAGILGFLYIALTVRVIHGRWKYRVGIGTGQNPDLALRIRVHGNFMEFAPIALGLIALVEIGGASPAQLHALGATLVIGRLLHVWGLGRSAGTSAGRMIGTTLTQLVIFAASVGAVVAWCQAVNLAPN